MTVIANQPAERLSQRLEWRRKLKQASSTQPPVKLDGMG